MKRPSRNDMRRPLCDSGGTRTPNRQNRNLLFYPIELRSHLRVQRYKMFMNTTKKRVTLSGSWLPDIFGLVICDPSRITLAKTHPVSQPGRATPSRSNQQPHCPFTRPSVSPPHFAHENKQPCQPRPMLMGIFHHPYPMRTNNQQPPSLVHRLQTTPTNPIP